MNAHYTLYLVMGKTVTLINREGHSTEMFAEKPLPSMSALFKTGFIFLSKCVHFITSKTEKSQLRQNSYGL